MSPTLEVISRLPEETQEVGRLLGEGAQSGDVFLLTGGLGTGKTTLTQGIAWGLGVQEHARSATFILIAEYQGRLPLYHMDLFRIDHLEEVLDLGLDEYLFGQGVSVVEWADKAPQVFPADHLGVHLELVEENTRRLHLKPHGERYQGRSWTSIRDRLQNLA